MKTNILSGITWQYRLQRLRIKKPAKISQGARGQPKRRKTTILDYKITPNLHIFVIRKVAQSDKMMKLLLHLNNSQKWASVFFGECAK